MSDQMKRVSGKKTEPLGETTKENMGWKEAEKEDRKKENKRKKERKKERGRLEK